MILPPGFATVAPYLMVRDAPAYLDFLIAGLGGVHLGSSFRPDGTVANTQVRLGESTVAATIMVGEARGPDECSRIDLMFYVPDAAAALARAVAAGAAEVMAVSDQPYGDRQAGVRDRWNITWWLSQRLTAKPYAFD